MFEYEDLTGQAVIIDQKSRLKSFHWTETGINFTIPNINKKMDLGIYEGDVAQGEHTGQNTIEVSEIIG